MMRLLAIDQSICHFNHLNIRCTFYVSREQSNKRTVPRRYNNIHTVLKNGCLRYLREINGNWIWYLYNNGFYDSARAGIWKEDELTDPVTGKFIRARLRGVDYEYGFEI
jgi:hypothetical protein